MVESFFALLISTLRVSTPLWFASLGGFMSERSGVVNIALEGFMLIGAFGAATAAHFTGSPWIGFFAGGACGSLLALIYALFVLKFHSDQIVAGTAINILAVGLTPFFGKIFFDVTGSTPALALADRFQYEPLVVAILLFGVVHLWFTRTASGLWLNFAGENPEALKAAGVSPKKVRWAGVLTAGFFAGLGGSSLSLYLASSFSREMTAGRGFIALAALILGKWRPIPTFFACLFFGFTEALQIRLQGLQIGGFQVPMQLIQVLPYLCTILILAGFIGTSKMPSALGSRDE